MLLQLEAMQNCECAFMPLCTSMCVIFAFLAVGMIKESSLLSSPVDPVLATP